VHILNGAEGQSHQHPRPFEAPPSTAAAVKALHKVVEKHRVAMQAVVQGFGNDGTHALFKLIADEIGVFNDISMADLDKECCSNSQNIVVLFKELHRLIEAHFQAVCYFSHDKAKQKKLVPAYTVSDYVFTKYDLEKIASGGE
jgi:hypothetical protein